MMSSRSFSRILAACAAGLSLVAVSTACAGEASEIGARGGFLVGQAYPCGVSAEQLRPSTQLVQELIAALAADGKEQPAAAPGLWAYGPRRRVTASHLAR